MTRWELSLSRAEWLESLAEQMDYRTPAPPPASTTRAFAKLWREVAALQKALSEERAENARLKGLNG